MQVKGVCDYTIVREGEDNVLKANCEHCPFAPSLEDSPICMARTIDKLAESPNITKIVFSQKRDFEYDFAQTQLVVEIAKVYNQALKEKILEYKRFAGDSCANYLEPKYAQLQNLVYNMLKSDPIGAFVELKRFLRDENIAATKVLPGELVDCSKKFSALLIYLIDQLDKTKLITIAKPYLAGYHVGDREVYRNLFQPTIKPDFMFTKLMAQYPSNGQELEHYKLGETEVTIFKFDDTVQYLYHLVPPEFRLEEEEYEILDMARKILAEHKPKRSDFVDPERMREVFYNVGNDLITELVEYKGYNLGRKKIDLLTNILVRYTVGFGLVEVLLQDDRIQDISVNSPPGQTPIFIVHQDFGDCYTNIVPTRTETESWASKLRLISGRPLDEANPILDTELQLPGANARVSAISEPLNPSGLAFSFRRHRDRPWTLPLFIKFGMLSPLAAGLISFLVDGNRTIIIAGTRSSGKSSLLSALMIELMRRYRVITIEDTLELPTASMRKLGYNIQSMRVASALGSSSSEVNASIGIRSTLRLGDSSLIIGEVRSDEAKALYEAMRVGAAANVVAGTIHGDSPYGVFDRVVNDIGVPKTSFKATDIIIVANPVRSADGLSRNRRVTQITEVRKQWSDDPLLEGAFIDLMKYDSKKDVIEPTSNLIDGDSEIIKAVAGNIKEFAGDWDAVWKNIELRAKIKEAIVEASKKEKDPEILEAQFVIKCNDMFHLFSDQVKKTHKKLDSQKIFEVWDEWLEHELKKHRRAKKTDSLFE
ncbi:type II/IV secretion system ATPase subunit [Candidatus Woesearchaeota archaeon]|nr:type II/IV secretion system ATPase subunit [Candidatus Woesearchaeota archaeon]